MQTMWHVPCQAQLRRSSECAARACVLWGPPKSKLASALSGSAALTTYGPPASERPPSYRGPRGPRAIQAHSMSPALAHGHPAGASEYG